MKKLFLPLVAAAIFSMSCNNEGDSKTPAGDDVGKKNLEVGRAVNQAIADKKYDELDKYIAKDGIDHSGDMVGGKDIVGLDSIKANLSRMMAGMKDMKMTAIKEFADGEYVFQWVKMDGTCTIAMPGMPLGPVSMNAIEVSKMKDGKAVEHWEFMQQRDMMKMMPSPEEMMKMHDMKGPVKP